MTGSRAPLPTGTVTFLLTDIEASTGGWETDRAAMALAVARHYELLDAQIAAAGGVRPVEQGEGDSIVAAFSRASEAVRAAVEIQLAFAAEPWPYGAEPAVRIALHTGEVALRDAGNYFGPTVIRCARLRAVAHGGQIVCSRATADVVSDALPAGVTLADLGTYRLKDLGRPEQIFQVRHPRLREEFPPLRTLDVTPNNLPVQLTSFVGREAELADLLQLARANRLLTLTGSGGVGKTRLAARAAAELAAGHRDGTWWVELAPLSDPDHVAETVLNVLRVADAPGSSALQRLIAYLATRDLLLVLDNCEHVVEACAALVDPLLRGCPGLHVVATSREALGVAGEITWQVPPMGLPAAEATVPVETLGTYDAVSLFVERSLRARPNFAVGNETAAVVAEICTRLDGIPLAIELAAARSRVLTPHQILAELEDRFRLLTGRTRGALARQQTLEASVAWSHDLLTEPERIVFRRLAVFAGSFTLDAAEAVAPATGPGVSTGDVLDLLETLVTKSMVAVLDGPEAAAGRYRLLETMRAFAARELARAEETVAARDAHLAYFLGVIKAGDRDLVGINPALLRRFTVEADNYRAALEWALAGDDPVRAVDLVVRWALVCAYRSRYREARDWAQRASALPAPPGTRVDALWALGTSQACMFDVPGITETAGQAMAPAQADGGARALGRAYHLEALRAMCVDPSALLAAHTAALPYLQAADDSFVLMDLQLNRLFVVMRADDLAAAAQAIAAAHELTDSYGNEFIGAWDHAFDAVLSVRTGALDRACAAAEESRRLGRGLGEVQTTALSSGALAEVELYRGAPDRALALVEPGVPACSEAGGYVALAYLMVVRSRALSALGRHEEARASLAETVATAAALQDPWQQAQAVLAHARQLVEDGEYAAVPEQLDVARSCGAAMGSPWVAAVADHIAGLLAAAQGDAGRAEDLHHAALAVHVTEGYALDVVDTLEALAELAGRQESWAESVRLLAAAAARREELGYRHGCPADPVAAREALGEEAYEAARKDGEALGIDAAVAYASRARGERGRPSFGWASLTPTELEVARLAARRASNPEIGRALFVSPNTVKTHLSHVYAKLGLDNRAELAAEVTRRETQS